MEIDLLRTGKKFNQEWIFRDLSYSFQPVGYYAILGANGSGKSTLLQVIHGNMQATEGALKYKVDGTVVPSDAIYPYMSIALPYQDLIWEFSLQESIAFQGHFKPFIPGLSTSDIIKIIHLERHSNKPLRYFSSGMKQRVRLALAILSQTPTILLDEPCMNLDANGRAWYNELLTSFGKDKLVIISSNHMEEEIRLCDQHIDIHQYKPR